MAALDILQTVTPTPVGGATSMTITFSTLTPGDIVLFFQASPFSSTTPPAGVQSYDTGGGGVPCRAFAKVVQAGDPLSWTFTTPTAGRHTWVAHRIEGPFTDLSTLQVSTRTGSASVTAFRIMGTDLTVNANTRAFAAIARNESGAVAFSNGFASVGSNAFVESVATATRLYTAGATDVHTEATWAAAAFPNAMLLRLQAQAAPPPTATLVIDTQPANSWNGETIRPAVVVRMTTNGTTTDTGFTGNVVATRQTGTGTLGGTMTVAAVAGVGTFPNLAVTGSGAHTLRFTANALTVDSTSFNVATGTGVPGGANLAYTEADMQQDVRALGAASQIGEVLILNTDGSPATGLVHNTAGLACNASTDGGAASPVTLAAMTLGGAYVSGGFVQINATTRPGWYAFGYPTFPSSGQRRSLTFTGTGLRPATVRVTMTAYDPTADNTAAQAQATAAAVRDNAIAQLQEGATFGESSIVLKDSTGADQTITVTRAARNAIASTT